MTYKFYLLAVSVDGPGGLIPEKVIWSDAAPDGEVPQSWTPLATNDAGDALLTEIEGELLDGAPMRDALIIYKGDAAFSVLFAGGQFIFNFANIFPEIGVLTQNCIQSFQGKHFIVTAGDVVVHDGNTYTSVIDNRMRQFLFAQLNTAAGRGVHTVHHKAVSEMWICFPAGEATRADTVAVWDYSNDEWSVRTIPEVPSIGTGIVDALGNEAITWDLDLQAWDLDATAWNQRFFNAVADGLIYANPLDSALQLGDATTTENGEVISAIVTRESLDFDMPDKVKLLKGLWLRTESDTPGDILHVRVGRQGSSGAPIDWFPEFDYIVGQPNANAAALVAGRFLSFQFRSDSVASWKLAAWGVEFSEQGRY